MNRTHTMYLAILALFYLIAWQNGYLIYGILLTAPVAYMRYTQPNLDWSKPVILGSLLCLGWYASNCIAFISLAPISDFGFRKVIAEITADLIRFPYLTGEAFSHSLYRTRLIIAALGLTITTYALVQTPFGRGLGLHRFLQPPGDYLLSTKHTQGSARWATELELRKYFTNSGPGTILGKNNDGIPYILPYSNKDFRNQRNQNVLVFGTTGSGKSISFVRPNILQADTSYVITDPKKEIYNDMAPYLKENGYEVHKFNLVDMTDSDCWNPLMKKDGTCDLSIQEAVMIASSLIANAKEPSEKKGDKFWDDSQQALLTALVIYATRHFRPDHPEPDKRYAVTLADILRFATGRRPELLDYDFANLPASDPARNAYNIFKQAGENVRSSIIVSLGTSLQLFQDDELNRITSHSDFDLNELGQKKTAIFVIISDSDTAYNSISALFFTKAFQELYRKASETDGTLPVFTKFLMDEFCNIGYIPDYTGKLSTMRSRGISAQMIIQSQGQLENRYPHGMASEIIGNCDIRLLMGANDIITATYFSDLIGTATVDQQTHSRSDSVIVDAGNISQRETKRQLMTPDELTRLDNQESLLLIRGTYPARIQKLHFEEHPNAANIPKAKNLTLVKPTQEKPAAPAKDTAADMTNTIETGVPDPDDTPDTNRNMDAESVPVDSPKDGFTGN